MKKKQVFSAYNIKDSIVNKYLKLEDIKDCKDDDLNWVHLNYKDHQNIKWINNNKSLPDIVQKSLVDTDPRPKMHSLNSGILLVLKGLNFEEKSKPEDMISIRIWVRKNTIISTSNRTLNSINEIKNELDNGELVKSSSEFIIKLLNKLNYKTAEFLEDLNDKIDDIDQNIMQGNPGNIRFGLANLRRQVVILKRYLTPQKEVVSKMILSNTAWISDSTITELHEELENLTKYLEDLNSIHEQTAILSELLMSNLSEKIGQRMYKLSIITLIFLPLTFFTGLFGANVGGIPLSQHGLGFGIISFVCLILVIIEILIFRKAKWL